MDTSRGSWVPSEGRGYPQRAVGTLRGPWVPSEGRGYPQRAVGTLRGSWVPPEGRGYLHKAIDTSREPWVSLSIRYLHFLVAKHFHICYILPFFLFFSACISLDTHVCGYSVVSRICKVYHSCMKVGKVEPTACVGRPSPLPSVHPGPAAFSTTPTGVGW